LIALSAEGGALGANLCPRLIAKIAALIAGIETRRGVRRRIAGHG
jgi:hypothetical protein